MGMPTGEWLKRRNKILTGERSSRVDFAATHNEVSKLFVFEIQIFIFFHPVL
jgi:hypothetical protein